MGVTSPASGSLELMLQRYVSADEGTTGSHELTHRLDYEEVERGNIKVVTWNLLASIEDSQRLVRRKPHSTGIATSWLKCSTILSI